MRLLLATLLCTPILAQAATLSVCTEASPEGFDVVQYNSLTTTNASADMLMNRLVEFDAVQGKLLPSLARSWSISAVVLYAANEARVVAGTPKKSITGWAQWCPVRTATPSRSRIVPTSCG